jgi:hypothetical protein
LKTVVEKSAKDLSYHYYQLLKSKTMKKLLYILAFCFAASLTVTSCTEEDVQPTENGGGEISERP